MKENESLYDDYSNGLPEDLDEEATTLLKLAKAHVAAKQIFILESEVKKRSKEKGITFAQAKRELVAESKPEREQFVSHTKKLLTPKLSKDVKQKLRIKEAGRPKGSKNTDAKTSQTDFYKKLEQLVRSKNQIGEVLTQKEAAIALELGGERQLRKRLREYGDDRRWKDLVNSLMT